MLIVIVTYHSCNVIIMNASTRANFAIFYAQITNTLGTQKALNIKMNCKKYKWYIDTERHQ